MKSQQSTDLELLVAWRAGDITAGGALLERHYASVHRFFSNRAGSDCEDLIQATFLGCIEAVERFRAEASFRTLLFAIAWKKLCRHIRDQPRHARQTGLGAEPAMTKGPTYGTQIDHGREAQLLLDAVHQLPEDTQVMLKLYYWESLSTKEIAQVLEQPLGTVKTQMHRGRAKLKKEILALRGKGP